MKLYTYFLLTIFISIIFSCNKPLKNIEDYYPNVQTVNLENLPDGSIKLTGRVLSPGQSKVTKVGFCYDGIPNPKIQTNQINIANGDNGTINGDEFTAIYEGLQFSTRQYFRAWAINEHGIGYGETITLDSVKITPVEAPCNHPMNRYNSGSGTKILNSFFINQQLELVSITAGGNGSMTVYIAKPALTGVYETSFPGGVYENSKRASISVNEGSVNFVIKPGSQIYVNKIGNNYEITCCNGTYVLFGSERNFWCRFLTN